MQAGLRRTIAVAEWESEELGRPGAQRYRDWMAGRGLMQHLTLLTSDGEILVTSHAQ